MKILFDCTVICLTEILIIWLTDEIWLDTNDRLKLYLVDRLSECSTRWNLVWLFELLFHCLKSCLLDWNKVWLTGVLLGWVNSVFTDMFSLSSFHCCVCQIWLTEQWTAVWLTHIACKFVGLKKSEIFFGWLKCCLTGLKSGFDQLICYFRQRLFHVVWLSKIWFWRPDFLFQTKASPYCLTEWNQVLNAWFAVSDKGFLHVVWWSEIWFWMPDFLFQTKVSPCSLFSCGRSSLCLGGHSQTSSDSRKSWSQMLVGFGFSHVLPLLGN